MSTTYNISSDMLESYSMSDFKEGEQVMICYGARTNSDLLIHNGFVIPFNSHRKEVHVSFGECVCTNFLRDIFYTILVSKIKLKKLILHGA